MLQTIHDKLKGVFAFVILGALAIVFVFWGVEFVRVGGDGGSTGLEVNGERIDVEPLRREYQQELARAQQSLRGEELPAEAREALSRQVLERAVRRAIVQQRATEAGFKVTDVAVVKSLDEIEAFKVDGKFSKDAYFAALKSAGLSTAQFESEQRAMLLMRQLDRGIEASSFVLPNELGRLLELVGERREYGWIVLPRRAFEAGVAIDDKAIASHYEQYRASYVTDESVALQYLDLRLDAVEAGVPVTEAALRGFYDQSSDRYVTVERRQARHILIQPGKDRDAARRKAQQIFDHLRAGADFAALARKESQDSGSAAQGGDLGWAERSAYVGPFADAVFTMKQGELRGPVETEFGFHVIRLDGIEAGHRKTFEEVRAELEPEYRRAEAEKIFGDLQEQLDTRSFEAGGNLQQVADAVKLPFRVMPAFTRKGGAPLGAEPRLVAAVFEESALSGQSIPVIELAPGHVVAVRVTSRTPPKQLPLEAVRDRVVAALRESGAERAARAVADRAAAELQSGAAWPEAIAGADITNATPSLRPRRADDVPQVLAEAVFAAARPVGRPAYGVVALPQGDVAVWALLRSVVADVPDEQKQAFARSARSRTAEIDAGVYLARLRNAAEVESNPKLFE
jgi:peptidyl-prolyl cis-trans isomerase D